MEALKLKRQVLKIETESEYHPTGSIDSPPPKKKSKKKKIVMQLESKTKAISKKPKRCLKSKDKQACLHNPKNSERKRARYSDMYDDVEAMFSVMERAERALACFGNGLPHFVKCMLPSNVAHGFWLHLPVKFCSLHLPKHDTSIMLVDEWGNEYKTSYLLGRHGLSAGWRGFAISHRLLKGDMLIFYLTEPFKLKVHIVRVNGIDVVDAALCLMNLDAFRKRIDSDNRKRKKTKYVEPFLLDNFKSTRNVEGEIRANVEVHEGSESNNQPQSEELCYSGSCFLHDYPHEAITC